MVIRYDRLRFMKWAHYAGFKNIEHTTLLKVEASYRDSYTHIHRWVNPNMNITLIGIKFRHEESSALKILPARLFES